MKDMQGNMHQFQSEGKTNNSNNTTPPNNAQKTSSSKGDYIDFEEVK
jgi:hypothetical protein